MTDSKLRNHNLIHYYISREFIKDRDNTTYPTSIQYDKIPHEYSRYILRYTMDPIYSSTLELHNENGVRKYHTWITIMMIWFSLIGFISHFMTKSNNKMWDFINDIIYNGLHLIDYLAEGFIHFTQQTSAILRWI